MDHEGLLRRAPLPRVVPRAGWAGGAPPPDHRRREARALAGGSGGSADRTAALLGVGGGGCRAPPASRADPERGVQEKVARIRQDNELKESVNIQHDEGCQKLQDELELQKSKEEKQRALLQLQWKVIGENQQVHQAMSSNKAITVTGTKKNEVVFSEIQSQLKNRNYTVDVKATSESKVITTVTINELYTPGLKGTLSIPTPYQKSAPGKVELQYLHPHGHAGISASVGLNANPLVNFSGVVGSKAVAFGVDVAFDTASGDFTKYNAGVSHTNQDLTASLNLNNKGDTLAASYYHQVHGTTAVGGEIAHTFSSNENTLTIGTQHELDPLTTVKARINNFGIASGLLQHAWRPKSLITFSTEVDTKAIEKSPKFGIALALKP